MSEELRRRNERRISEPTDAEDDLDEETGDGPAISNPAMSKEEAEALHSLSGELSSEDDTPKVSSDGDDDPGYTDRMMSMFRH